MKADDMFYRRGHPSDGRHKYCESEISARYHFRVNI